MIQPVQNFFGIFTGAEVYNYKVQIVRYAKGIDIDSIAVERHHDGAISVGAALIHSSAAGRCRNLTEVSALHLAANRHF